MAEGLLQNLGATSVDNPTNISEKAQDVAKATGVAYSDIGKPETATTWGSLDTQSMNKSLQDNAKVTDGLSFVNQDKSTVQGQLKSLLSQDNPYITQARQEGERTAAKRGMLNSSMAAGASEASAIKAALPIAQQDATTYATAQSKQQDVVNAQQKTTSEAIISSELAKQNADIKQTQQNIQNQFTAQMQNASDQTKVWLQDFQQQHQDFVDNLNREQQSLLQNQQISAEKATSIRTQASNIMQNYQVSVENLMSDPDFLNLGSAALQNTIKQLQTLASNSINFIGASSGVDLSGFVDTFLEPISISK